MTSNAKEIEYWSSLVKFTFPPNWLHADCRKEVGKWHLLLSNQLLIWKKIKCLDLLLLTQKYFKQTDFWPNSFSRKKCSSGKLNEVDENCFLESFSNKPENFPMQNLYLQIVVHHKKYFARFFIRMKILNIFIFLKWSLPTAVPDKMRLKVQF